MLTVAVALAACGGDDKSGPIDGGGARTDAAIADSGARDSAALDAPFTGDDARAPDDGGAADDGGSSSSDAGMTSACPEPLPPDAPLSCFARCSSDDECMWVDSTCCCGCNMGGESQAISTRFAKAWSERMAAMCAGGCSGVACLAVYRCPVRAPTCSPDGLCTGDI